MLDKLSKVDFRHHVDCDYDTHRNCREHGCDDGICRCSTIHNARITHVDINDIILEIYGVYFNNDTETKRDTAINSVLFGIDRQMDLYTIDRILRAYKIWRSESWDIEITWGYYGQEIESINLNVEIVERIEQDLDIAFSIEDFNGRIEYLLGVEYGYLLPELENCKYELMDIKKSDIIFGSINHYKKLEKCDYYNDLRYNNIRGIVIENGGKYRLIDGYHRVFSTNLPIISVLKATKKI